MTTTSKRYSVSKLEKKLKGRRCPRCTKKKLIPKYPRRSNAIRCMNCGATGRLN